MCIYQGSFMEKTSEIINIILPISFGYELPLLKNSIIKHMINLYKFTNNSIKKIRHIIWNNNNLKTSEDSILLFQIFLEFFNNQNYKNYNYIFINNYKNILYNIFLYNFIFIWFKYYISSLNITFKKSELLNYTFQTIYNNQLIKVYYE